jgi:hypothetical protein
VDVRQQRSQVVVYDSKRMHGAVSSRFGRPPEIVPPCACSRSPLDLLEVVLTQLKSLALCHTCSTCGCFQPVVVWERFDRACDPQVLALIQQGSLRAVGARSPIGPPTDGRMA